MKNNSMLFQPNYTEVEKASIRPFVSHKARLSPSHRKVCTPTSYAKKKVTKPRSKAVKHNQQG